MLDLVRRGVPPTVAMTRIGRAKATISMREDRDSEFAARLAEAEAEAEGEAEGAVDDLADRLQAGLDSLQETAGDAAAEVT